MRLSPIPWLGSIGKALFNMQRSEDQEAAAVQRLADIRRHEKTLSDANDLETMAGSPGYAILKALIEVRREQLREQLEKGSGNVALLRARLEELKQVLALVPEGIALSVEARKALVELESYGDDTRG